MNDLVWYASYGSNLLRERLLVFLQGGRVAGCSRLFRAARYPARPLADKPFFFRRGLVFAQHSSEWDGAVAFLDSRPEARRTSYGRRYLMTADQFRHIVAAENGADDHRGLDGVDIDAAVRSGSTRIEGAFYDHLFVAGYDQGYPILSFTASDPTFEHKQPSEAYLSLIIRGLFELNSLSPAQIASYLSFAPGIQGNIHYRTVAQMVASLDPTRSGGKKR